LKIIATNVTEIARVDVSTVLLLSVWVLCGVWCCVKLQFSDVLKECGVIFGGKTVRQNFLTDLELLVHMHI
jgi:hypothetical protein